jgi:hypothetical protein
MLIAEDLEVDLPEVRLESVLPNGKLYGNSLLSNPRSALRHLRRVVAPSLTGMFSANKGAEAAP